MLERHEEEALAEIEAHLYADDPELGRVLDAGAPPPAMRPVARCVAVIIAVLVFITVTTMWFGPDAGGLAAVLGLSYAFLYSWAALRVCRGQQPEP